ncbi:unnamed protein product, partial [Mesorhabditis spiculigera]
MHDWIGEDALHRTIWLERWDAWPNNITTATFHVRFGRPADPDREEVTTKFLARYRLIHNVQKCPGDQLPMSLVKDKAKLNGFLWRCSSCRSASSCSKYSIRKDSWFTDSKLTFYQEMSLLARWSTDPEFPPKPYETIQQRWMRPINGLDLIRQRVLALDRLLPLVAAPTQVEAELGRTLELTQTAIRQLKATLLRMRKEDLATPPSSEDEGDDDHPWLLPSSQGSRSTMLHPPPANYHNYYQRRRNSP